MALETHKPSNIRRRDSAETTRPVGFGAATRRPSDPAGTTARPPASQPGADGHGVLLVEDDLALTRSLSRALSAEGVDVTTVTDGAEALEKLLAGGYEVVLSDIHMPGMSGIELLRVVSSYNLDVPIILMTGQPEVDTAVEAMDRGAVTYLRKPTPMPMLLSAIERARAQHRETRKRRDAERALGLDDSPAKSNATLAVHFDRAMEGIWLAFQPIVSARGRLVGYEALMRSDEPALPTPQAVLGAAERLDRLHVLGRRVRKMAGEAFERAPKDALLFVNLHLHDLLDPELFDGKSALASFSERVVLELSERTDPASLEDLQARVSVLRYQGFRIAIDDLGAGYSGLNTFASLEPDLVKLDMALIRNIDQSPARQRVVKAMITMCKGLGMEVVAEGVETNAEKACVVELGADFLQGHLFAKPGRAFARPLSVG